MPLLHNWKSWSWPAVPVTLRNVEWFKAGKKAIWKGRRRENEWNSPACLYRHRDAVAEKGHLGLREIAVRPLDSGWYVRACVFVRDTKSASILQLIALGLRPDGYRFACRFI